VVDRDTSVATADGRRLTASAHGPRPTAHGPVKLRVAGTGRALTEIRPGVL